ncbi:MAG: hypothetical protein SFY92_08475 [Verrucomicrobiae bacterium]|nr:hypothetical protein [Verrucomicrobiae bacterium]
MALNLELKEGVIISTTVGDVDFEEGFRAFSQAIEKARTSSASTPQLRWHLIFNLLESTEKRSAHEIQGIAQYIGSHRDILSGRCAMVVTQPLYFGLSRMFGTFLEKYGVEMAVFDSMEKAHDWITPPPAPPPA